MPTRLDAVPVEYVDLPIYRDQLASALKFTPSELAVNRAGRLSDSQRATLHRLIARYVGLSIVFIVLTAAAVVWALAIGVGSGLGVRLLLVAAAFLAFVGVFTWYMVPLWRDVAAGVVSSIEGMVRTTERETDIGTGHGRSFPIWSHYWVVDDSQRFPVAGMVYAALTPARHRVYFLPLTRRIVAAEPVSSQNA
jgi:hypothetical protein